MILTLIGEDNEGDPITPSQLPEWADTFGLTHPVLADPEFETTLRYMISFPISLPARHWIVPGMVIDGIDAPMDEDAIREALTNSG